VVLKPPGRGKHLAAVGARVLARLVHVKDVTLDAALGQVDLLAVGTGEACRERDKFANRPLQQSRHKTDR
jgi:hypothetical protein